MQVKVTPAIRNKIFAALMGAGVAGPVAFVGANHTVNSEGMFTHVYLDPVGLQTYCVGHLARKTEKLKKEYTVDECIAIFVKDWQEHTKQLDAMVKVPWRSDWMYGSAIDFTFHMGAGKVKNSTFLKKLNNKQYDAACEELTKWVYGRVNGVLTVLPGLLFRATERYKFCMGEVPGDYKTTMQQWEASK